MNTKAEQRKERKARVMEHLRPANMISHRQATLLNRILAAHGPERMNEVWMEALTNGDGSPAHIQKAMEDTPKPAEDTPATVEDTPHRTQEDTPATVEDTPKDTPTRLEKLKNAHTVLNNLNKVHQFAMESNDLDTLDVYGKLLELVVKWSGMGKAIVAREYKAEVDGLLRELDGDDG